MKKRFLSFLLALLAFLAILPPGEASFFGPGSFAGSGFFKPPSVEVESEFIEEEDEVPSSGTTETPVVTLPYTPPLSEHDYFIFWTTYVKHSHAAVSTQTATVRLRNTTDATLLNESIVPAYISQTNDWMPVFGFAKYTSESTPSEKDFELSVQVPSGMTATLRKSAILIIQADEGDQWVAEENETSGSGTVTKATLSWTPEEDDIPYLIFGQAEIGNAIGTVNVSVRLNKGGTFYGGNFAQHLWSTSVRRPWATMVKLTLPASSQTITLQHTLATFNATCRRARILALDLRRFPTVHYNEDRATSTNTDNSYTDPAKAVISETLSKGQYLIFGTDIHRFTSTATNVENALIIDGSTDQEANHRPKQFAGSNAYGHTFFLKKKAFQAGSHTIKMDFAGDGTNTVESQQAALAVIKL